MWNPSQGGSGGQDVEPVVLDFRESGADEVITKTQTLVAWFDKLIERIRGLSKEAKASKEAVSGNGSLLEQLRKDLEDLKRSYEGRTPTEEEGKRRIGLYRQIRQLEVQESGNDGRRGAASVLKEMKEAGQEGSRQMESQKGHVAWIVRMLESAGLGHLSRWASAGAAGASRLVGMLGMGTLSGVGTMLGGVGGFAATAAITAGSMGLNRLLGASPAHAQNMEIAGYINPFEANYGSRVTSKMMAEFARLKRNALAAAGESADSFFGNIGVGMSTAWPTMKLWGAKASGSFDDQIPGIRAEIDEALRKGKKLKEDPTVGEVRWLQQITGSSMHDYRPQSDMARMGLYASTSEALAVRSQFTAQQEMITVLKEAAGLLKALQQNYRDEQAKGGGTFKR